MGFDPDFTVIGEITEHSNGAILVTTGGSEIPLQAKGRKHLSE